MDALTLSQHQDKLCSALGFTLEDLAINQQGLISDRQIRRLRRDLRVGYGLLIASTSALVITLALSVIVYLHVHRSGWSAFILLFAVFCPLPIRFAARLRRARRRIDAAYASRQRIVIGRGELKELRASNAPRFNTDHDESTPSFIGNPDLYRILQPNCAYDVYYVPEHRIWTQIGARVLSMRPDEAHTYVDMDIARKKGKR